MSRAFQLLTLIRRFVSARGGNIVVMFAVVLPVVIGIVGAGIDFGRATDARAAIAVAIDAAILAAAKELGERDASDDEVVAIASRVFQSNIDESGLAVNGPVSITFSIDRATRSVSAVASGEVSTTMIQLVGIDTLDLSVDGAARFSDRTVELAMVLDVTGSMRGSKIEELKNAAKEAVDILMPKTDRNSRIRIGLVPYAASVNAGRYASTVTTGRFDDDDNRFSTRRSRGSTCVTERSGDLAHRDDSAVGAPVGTDRRAVCPEQEILPLTKNREDILEEIEDFEAEGYTAGHLGAVWSYYMLSPSWSTIWPNESRPEAYGDDGNLKIVILMTDGRFNTFYDGVRGGRSEPFGNQRRRSEAYARAVCDNMKGDDIIVYSVAFQAPRDAERLLRDCASSGSGYYFSADNGDELRAAFRDIAIEIKSLRLTY